MNNTLNILDYDIADGQVTITEYDMFAQGDLVIPNEIEGLPVTSIGVSAFEGCGSLTSITTPDGVTIIGDWTFSYCRSLTSITIPDSVTSIGDRAFCGCRSLTSIRLPERFDSPSERKRLGLPESCERDD